MAENKYSEAKEELGKLIDREDKLFSPGAIYFGMRLALAEKGSSYLNEINKYHSKLKRLYPENEEFIALGDALIKDTLAKAEEDAYNDLIKQTEKNKDYELKSKLLSDFIKGNPNSKYIDKAKELLEQVKAELQRQRTANYQAAIDAAQRSFDQSRFDDALKSLDKALTFTDDPSEVAAFKDKLELAMLQARGIEPLVPDRDTASRAFLKIKIAKDGAEMVLIPASELNMGSDNGPTNEKPAHRVTLQAYYIDVYEVSNAQFKKFTDATGYKTDAEKAGKGWAFIDGVLELDVKGVSWRNPTGPGSDIDQSMDCPVVQVSWNDAAAYAQWAGKRLPTEAEWEKMARGNSSTSAYPWGQDWSTQKCNTTESGNGKPVKIGNYQMDKSLSGCFDIIGNISEWCYDYYDETYYQRSPSKDPKGPEMGTVKAIRGGSWISKGVDIKTTYRKPGGISSRLKATSGPVSFWSNYIGFRCAKDVK